MKDEVFLDNLPRTANQILNVLWSRNRAMAVNALLEAVHVEYMTYLERREIQKVIKLNFKCFVEQEQGNGSGRAVGSSKCGIHGET